MRFMELSLGGAFLIEPARQEDERGFFARTWCREEFAAHGIACAWVQCNVSFNRRRGTLRGLHYQAAPWEEAKLVRCTMGALYDVVLDLRPTSPTFKKHIGVELSASNRLMIYVPNGCAHGFQTLEDETEIFYQISEFYRPEHTAGVRWDDPAFGISWPHADPIMSERDRRYPDFTG